MWTLVDVQVQVAPRCVGCVRLVGMLLGCEGIRVGVFPGVLAGGCLWWLLVGVRVV